MGYKRCSAGQARNFIPEAEIHEGLRSLVEESSPENRQMAAEMTQGLTKWIEYETEGNKIEAAQRILTAYLEKSEWLGLEELGLTSLPPEIGQLGKLRSLDLDHNQLEVCPEGIGQLANLEEVDLSMNQITVLSPEIGGLLRLRYINLEKNYLIESEIVRPFPYGFAFPLIRDIQAWARGQAREQKGEKEWCKDYANEIPKYLQSISLAKLLGRETHGIKLKRSKALEYLGCIGDKNRWVYRKPSN